MPAKPLKAFEEAGRPARSKKGENRRDLILQAARTQLVEQGYDKLVLRGIADQLGITLGNLQYYFPSRESLVEAVVLREAESDRRDLQELCERGDGNRTDFDAFVTFIVEKWRGDSGKILGLMNFFSLHSESFQAIYRDVYEQFYDALVNEIACANPDLDKRTCRARARLVTALIDGAALQTQQGSRKKFLAEVAQLAYDIVMAPT